MPDRNEYRLRWVSQGETVWEDWWVASHGKTKTQIPSEDDHVSFANYDLRGAGLSEIYWRGRMRAISLAGDELPLAVAILKRHGFIVVEDHGH